jgi:hypothetical protein
MAPVSVIDIVVVAGLGLGFFRGRKRGLGLELYKLVNIGIPVLAGCGLYTLAGSVVRLIPGLGGEGSGLLGFVGVFAGTFFVLRTVRKRLRVYLAEKFGEASRTAAGLVGTTRAGVLLLGLLTGIQLSPARFVAEGSLFGRIIGALTGTGGS